MISPRRIAIIAGFALLLGSSVAHGATFTVTKTSDTFDGACDADCSLREAVQAANGDATADEVILPAGVIRLTIFGPAENANATGDLDIANDLTVRGAGAALTTVFQTQGDRVFDVTGPLADVTFRDLTISGGRSPLDEQGGGIRHQQPADLTLERVVVRGNTVTGSTTGYGGGIGKDGGGRLTVLDSAIVGNSAIGSGFGGGVFVSLITTTVSMTNVTIADNAAERFGGGIFSNNAIAGSFVHVTMTRNQSTMGAGGIDGDVGGFRFRSSVVSGNIGAAPASGDCPSGAGPASDGGNVGPAACGFTLPTDVVTANAFLEPLNATSVIPVAVPAPGSPALDRAVGACPAADARALPRPQGAACDSGAAERPVPPLPPVAPDDCTIRGTDGADVLRGTNGADVICGLAGDDVIRALRGDDIVLAGRGKDRVFAGAGADVVYGGQGNDRLDGGPGGDVLFGGAGLDVLLGRDKAFDVLDGGTGRDAARSDTRDLRRSVERKLK